MGSVVAITDDTTIFTKLQTKWSLHQYWNRFPLQNKGDSKSFCDYIFGLVLDSFEIPSMFVDVF